MILLSSSEPDALCYIETANLDGETNLKIRQGRPETANILSSHQAREMHGHIETELPNNSLYTFEGTMDLTSIGKQFPLDPAQLLLRVNFMILQFSMRPNQIIINRAPCLKILAGFTVSWYLRVMSRN